MVHVFDVASGKVAANILVGTRPRRFALTADGSELWVSDELAAQVAIIDPTTNMVKEALPLIPPGAREVDVTPVGLALSPDVRTMYVSLGRANHVAFVDVATREAEFVLVGSRAWDWSRYGSGGGVRSGRHAPARRQKAMNARVCSGAPMEENPERPKHRLN